MSALLTEKDIPITILWSNTDLADIIAAAEERGVDPIKMMKQAILDSLFS